MLDYTALLFLLAGALSLALAVGAFIAAGNGGRLLISAIFGLAVVVPKLWPGIAMRTGGLVARLCLGIGCYLFLKARGELKFL